MLTSKIPDTPLITVEVIDDEFGIEAYICIHSMGKHGASGGMRCLPDVSKKEVQILAKAMAYKYSFWNVKSGGAKAGLVLPYDIEDEKKYAILKKVAQKAEPLIKMGIWSPWSDMNFSGNDLSEFYSGIEINVTPSKKGSSRRTAASAFSTLVSYVEHKGLNIKDVKIAIEGFGNVAKYLAEDLLQYGVKITAVSNYLGAIYNENGLDIKKMLKLDESNPVKWIEAKGDWDTISHIDLFKAEVDILMPGARVHAIDDKIAENIKASVLIPFANVPCTDDALNILDKKSIIFVPDYVVNGGGVCGHVLGGKDGYSEKQLNYFNNSFIPMIKRLLKSSETSGKSIREISDVAAHANFNNVTCDPYSGESIPTRLLSKIKGIGPMKDYYTEKDQNIRSKQTIDFIDGLFTEP